MTVSIDAEKPFVNTFYENPHSKLEMKRNFHNLINII